MALSRIVIIHTFHDNELGHCLVRALRAVGYQVWYDRWDWLNEHNPFTANKQHPLPEGDIYLLMLSKASLSSERWQKTTQEVLATNKIVLPVLYEPVSPEGFLNLRHFLNVVGLDCAAAARRVIAELERITSENPIPSSTGSNLTISVSRGGRLKPLYKLLLVLVALFLLTSSMNDMVVARRAIPVHSPASPAIYAGSTNRYVYALHTRDGSLIWKHWIGGQALNLNVTLFKETVYVSTGDDRIVYALRVRDGSELWKYRLPDSVDQVTIINNVVYVASSNIYKMHSEGPLFVCAFQASTGALLWCHNIWGAVISSPLIVFAGVVYAATSDSYIYALRARDGLLLWSHVLKNFSNGLQVTASIVYVSAGNQLCAWRTQDGLPLWCFKTGGEFTSAPFIFEQTIYLGSSDGHVYALTLTGKRLWQYQSQTNSSPTRFVVTDDVVCVVADDNNNNEQSYFYGLSKSTGKFIWSYQMPAVSGLSPTLKGVVYIGALDGIRAITVQTGALAWQYASITRPVSPSLLLSQGTIYFGSYDAYLYAMSTDGQFIWRYPTGGTVVMPAVA